MRAKYNWVRRWDVYLPDFMPAWRPVMVASSSSKAGERGTGQGEGEDTAVRGTMDTAAAPRAVDSRNSRRETGCEGMAGSREGRGNLQENGLVGEVCSHDGGESCMPGCGAIECDWGRSRKQRNTRGRSCCPSCSKSRGSRPGI